MKTMYVKESKLNEYEKENKRVSYANVCDRFLINMILNNKIYETIGDSIGYEEWELYNGSNYDEENDEYADIYQYYIINGYIDLFIEYLPDEIIFYSEKLDIYLLGVTHLGTAWGYVLTDVGLENYI